MTGGDVLFEFVQVGRMMRVAAIDEATGIEVIVIAPLNAHRTDMQRLALAKLHRRLAESTTPTPVTPGKFA
jgi:hypothetical protein